MRNIRVKLWGVRGSLPSPGARTATFGGNTSCIEVQAGGKTIIFDAGSGIREAGEELIARGPSEFHLFFTHYHWDHIMGFPFFIPAYAPTNRLHVYGETKGDFDVKKVLETQMSFPMFPVSLSIMRAKMDFHAVEPGQRIKLGEVSVRAHRLNHPFHSTGYRVDYNGSSVCYITDYEHYPHRDEPLIEFVRDTSCLIYDAAFSDEEYAKGKQGWGHSTWQESIKLAKAANVKKLIISHHEPSHDDKHMLAVERKAKKLFKNAAVAREKRILWY